MENKREMFKINFINNTFKEKTMLEKRLHENKEKLTKLIEIK